MTHTTETLRVAETSQDDIGLGTARLELAVRERLHVAVGEIVELVGTRSTGAIVEQAREEDEGKGVVRMEYVVRRNAGAPIADRVSVRKLEPPNAESIVVAPIPSRFGTVELGPEIEPLLSKALTGRPLGTGDMFLIPGVYAKGEPVLFRVTTTRPTGIVKITARSQLSVREESASGAEG